MAICVVDGSPSREVARIAVGSIQKVWVAKAWVLKSSKARKRKCEKRR
jgi:hypothetical protein